MRLHVGLLVVGLSVAAWSVPVMAKTETLTGKVVDLTCYSQNKTANSGMDHARTGQAGGSMCAMACTKWEGQPAGLVTADGKMYQITGGLAANNNAKITPHMTHNVTITGDVTEVEGVLMLAADSVTMTK